MYSILWHYGDVSWGFETVAAAEYVIRNRERDAKIGHPGDLSSGGSFTLAWPNESIAASGGSAIAMILRIPPPKYWRLGNRHYSIYSFLPPSASSPERP